MGLSVKTFHWSLEDFQTLCLLCVSVRDLVLTCHLKPLEKKDKEGAPRKQPWNPVAPSNKGCTVALSNEEDL